MISTYLLKRSVDERISHQKLAILKDKGNRRVLAVCFALFDTFPCAAKQQSNLGLLLIPAKPSVA